MRDGGQGRKQEQEAGGQEQGQEAGGGAGISDFGIRIADFRKGPRICADTRLYEAGNRLWGRVGSGKGRGPRQGQRKRVIAET
jgi:hypothetical protein